jgi:hypothetical protein
MVIFLGPGGINELLVNSSLHLLVGHISSTFSPSISKFEIVGSIYIAIQGQSLNHQKQNLLIL